MRNGLINVAYRKAMTCSNPSVTTLEQEALVPMFGSQPVELRLEGHERRGYAMERPMADAVAISAA